MSERLTHGLTSLLSIPIDGLLTTNTTRRPWHGCEAFCADLRFAINAGPKRIFPNSLQCGSHASQQSGLAVYISDREISFRGILNLVHRIRAPLDCDAAPL